MTVKHRFITTIRSMSLHKWPIYWRSRGKSAQGHKFRFCRSFRRPFL